MNKKVVSLAGAISLALSAAAAASDYQFELGGEYQDLDVAKAWSADFRWYFQPVTLGTGPLAEAAFLNRASNIGLGYLRDTKGDFDAFGINAEAYFGDFYLASKYNRVSFAASFDNYGLTVGRMLGDRTRVTLGFERTELPFDQNFDIYALGVKHLAQFAGNTALNLEAEAGVARNGSSEFAYQLGADYYLNRMLSIGAKYGGVGSDDGWGLRARYFFTPRVSAGVEYSREDGDNTYGFRLSARF